MWLVCSHWLFLWQHWAVATYLSRIWPLHPCEQEVIGGKKQPLSQLQYPLHTLIAFGNYIWLYKANFCLLWANLLLDCYQVCSQKHKNYLKHFSFFVHVNKHQLGLDMNSCSNNSVDFHCAVFFAYTFWFFVGLPCACGKSSLSGKVMLS